MRLISEYEPSKRMMIDVESLFNCYTCYHMQNGKCNTFCDAGESYRPDINKLEIIEAEPVRHGYWKVHITSCRMYFECSECKKLFSNPLWTFDNDNKQLRDFMEEDNVYCRGCGSKMDGKEVV